MSEEFRRNRRIQSELGELERLGILDAPQVAKLRPEFPTTPVSLAFLGWLLVGAGAMLVLAGIVFVLREPILEILQTLWHWLSKINWWIASELALGSATAGALWRAQTWKRTQQKLQWVPWLEFWGAVGFLAFTSVLAAHHSQHDGKWPHLLVIQAIATMAMAYAFSHRGILWMAAWLTFTALGAETGYWSGWGAYWLGMDVPERVLAAGLISLTLAAIHTHVDNRWKPFLRVYLHYGLLLTHLSLWFLAIFGSHQDHSWQSDRAERLFFSAVWAVISGACLWAGHKTGLRLVRGYGMTFLVINLYTFYFQFVVANTSDLWFWHLLLVGASLVAWGFQLERLRKNR